MQYEVLRQNDDGTVQVRMTIDDHILEQAFAVDKLDENVKLGMAVFKSELDKNLQPLPDTSDLIGKVQTVQTLPNLE